MSLCCTRDERRDAVRRMNGRNGLDYVEVSNDQLTLDVYFLGKLPPELAQGGAQAAAHLAIEGGQRVTGINIVAAEAVPDPDPEKDDVLTVKLDKYGDFSTYTLRLVGVENIDPRYDGAEFSFKVNCPSDLDCKPACECEPAVLTEPEINYLAKDYTSFRQLILDRLAVLIPEWTERHAADIGITLVELLAYTGDYLSYCQDAAATESYLDTARQRVSVRRHARLVDYRIHEGCNARAWVSLEVSGIVELKPADTAFITGLNDALAAKQTALIWDDLEEVPAASYEVFEPLVPDPAEMLRFIPAHNEIHFHTWGLKECCLEKGSTTAALLDSIEYTNEGGKRALDLHPGEVLMFEELLGARTGLPADADVSRRHAVRLTRVEPGEDPVTQAAYVEIEWAPEDALPFAFCLSATGLPPECPYLTNISVARGNVILADHGKTEPAEPIGTVSERRTEAVCECAGHPGEVQIIPDRFRPRLRDAPVTFSEPLARGTPPASAMLKQDARQAIAQIHLQSKPERPWRTKPDLIGSSRIDWDYVVEIDNDGLANLRFGDGECGAAPPAGMEFTAIYRTGNGIAGNVGAEAISRLVGKDRLSGVSVKVRNPLPAQGGVRPEPLVEAKLMAPTMFRTWIERAITSDDYETVAERNAKVQRASANLVWTGSWYEADVAIDPLGRPTPGQGLLDEIELDLERYRRIGHDLDVLGARYVPLDLKLEVCALPRYDRGHVKAALLDAFSARTLAGGRRGYFHPDNLSFGEGVYLSKIIAVAQSTPGVECVEVKRFRRLFEAPNREIENGVLPLRNSEIARLDSDPSFPENGKLEIVVKGGR